MKNDLLELSPNENVLFEDEGYTVTEIPEEDGMSRYTVYDSYGNYLDEFEDLSSDNYASSPEELKKTILYDQFMTIVRSFAAGFDDDWDSFYALNKFDDYKYIDYKPKELSPEEIEAKKKEEAEMIESLCKSDTIVFHQTDPTTVMLDPIYEGRGWDVYKGSGWGVSKEFFHELFKRHDKILFLGHGTPHGLLSGVVDSSDVQYIKGKKIFALWCYAATFFKRNGFEGDGVFCSDNCPSEDYECKWACDATVSKEWIYNNMVYLGECLRDVIDICWENPYKACEIARREYHKSYDTCKTDDERAVVEFNTNTLQVV